jgi:DNA-binding CsgD family transcriptional regulator
MSMSERPFEALTDRQRIMLRHVLVGRTSAQIARELGTTPTTVDDQMKKAMAKLGVPTRADAAREFAAFEAGLQRPDPHAPELRNAALWPLLLPVPTKSRPTNELTWVQILAWGAIMAIGFPLLITIAALLMITLRQLLGGAVHH